MELWEMLQGESSFVEGVTEEQIARFETSRNIKLPEQYKQWLRFSDGGEAFLPAGVQFYGVAHKPFIIVQPFICATKEEWLTKKDYIMIGTLSSGDPVLCKNGEETICIYNQEKGIIEEDEVYKDLTAFLEDQNTSLGISD